MIRRTKGLALIAGGGAAVLALTGCRAALPPTDPANAATFTVSEVGSPATTFPPPLGGQAFTVAGQVVGSAKDKEIVGTAWNFTPGAQGPVAQPGFVSMYQKSTTGWTSSVVVPTSEGIIAPNEPTIADVNRDGRNDIIVPAGYLFSVATGKPGSLTWWENKADGTFARHDIVASVGGNYHSAVFVDFDGDGKKDIITTLEDGGFPSWPFAGPPIAPSAQIQFLKGDGTGNFAAPIKLADGGGSFPVVFDINADGKLDIASAQYWKVKTTPIQPFGITNESAVWFEQGSDGVAGLGTGDFTKHVIASGLGESFALVPVDNIDGNGKYGAILTNHTNPTQVPGSAAPQAFRLTPGADVTQPWNVESIASFTLSNSGRGQAAPGKVTEGDLDGDGDIDLALSGDADWGLYWLERTGTGSWVKHDLRTETGNTGADWGQGSAAISDLNSDGRNEIAFGSYNADKVFVAERTPGTGGNIPAVPHLPDLLQRY